MKHTKGPWFHFEKTNCSSISISTSPTLDEERSAWIEQKIDTTVCGVFGLDERCQANAALIAAAPDLLAACEALKEAYTKAEESESIDWQDLDDAAEKACEALKKAKGDPS